MRTSECIDKIFPALIRAQGKFPAILRTKIAKIKGDKADYSFNYAPLEEILHVLKPTLQEEELGLMQGVEGFHLVTTIMHASGQWISHWMEMPHAYASPRAFGSELTFRRRYSVTSVLGLASEEDDDGQSAEHGVKKREKRVHPIEQQLLHLSWSEHAQWTGEIFAHGAGVSSGRAHRHSHEAGSARHVADERMV